MVGMMGKVSCWPNPQPRPSPPPAAGQPLDETKNPSGSYKFASRSGNHAVAPRPKASQVGWSNPAIRHRDSTCPLVIVTETAKGADTSSTGKNIWRSPFVPTISAAKRLRVGAARSSRRFLQRSGCVSAWGWARPRAVQPPLPPRQRRRSRQRRIRCSCPGDRNVARYFPEFA